MDIIASHQSGLVEQLEAEAAALAGRPRDAVQRAIVCHHVADMVGLSHGYALLAARASLGIDDAVARMDRRARRWQWRSGRAERAALGQRVAVFGETLRRLDAERCVGVLMAYRLVATPGLGGEAERRLDPELLASLRAVQAGREQASGELRRDLFMAHRHWAEEAFGARLSDAGAALQWPFGPAAVRAAMAAVLIPARDYDRAERRGLTRIAARLRRAKRMPQGFAANPAQAFFNLQREVVERRRRNADGDRWSPDEAVMLAA